MVTAFLRLADVQSTIVRCKMCCEGGDEIGGGGGCGDGVGGGGGGGQEKNHYNQL